VKPTVIFVLVFLLAVSCIKKKSVSGDSALFSKGKPLAELTERKLQEVSGLAASAYNNGFLWTHNDSGNPPEIYLVDEQLQIRLTCKLQGVKNRDWEEIAIGPGPDKNKSYLYVADIGDNNSRHNLKYIYRFEEPVLSASQNAEIIVRDFDTIVFRLEDGSKDTEAIIIHPKTKDLYVLSKRERPVYLYKLKFPFSLKDTLTAEKVLPIPLTQIVSAAISPDGNEILMKNYDNIYYWHTQGKPLTKVLKKEPHLLKYTEEPQGEAIAFNVGATGFYTLSEKLQGEKTFLYFYQKKGAN
jgi:hypothetical protein